MDPLLIRRTLVAAMAGVEGEQKKREEKATKERKLALDFSLLIAQDRSDLWIAERDTFSALSSPGICFCPFTRF